VIGVKDHFKNMMCNKKGFLQDLDLLIVKNQLPLQFVENIGLNIWFNNCVFDFFSLLESSFFKKYYQTWWKNIYVCVCVCVCVCFQN